MRIMLTVVTGQGHRDVVVDGDESVTAAALASALADLDRPANVVRLPRVRAPYGMDRTASGLVGAARLWHRGTPLPADAPVFGLLRDGDVVATDPEAADATVLAEPGGVVELRAVGGPAAGSVHRLGLGAHTIGADPGCAVVLPVPERTCAVVRVTPRRITVEPYPAADPPDGAAESGPALDGEPVAAPVDWAEGALLRCGDTLLSCGAPEPPDAHLDPLPDGGLAYNRPPRLRPPGRRRRFEVPAEPRRTEGMRLQLLAALLPAVLGVAMALLLRQWYFLLFAFMTPLIMIGQWLSDRRHGRKQYRQAMQEYRERLAEFEAAVERARAADEADRRAAAPDPAELLLTATGPRRRLWERRGHDPDALRLRVGLADLPADLEFVAEQSGQAAARRPPLTRDVPVTLPLRHLGVAGLTGPRDVCLALARWLVGQAAVLHSPRDLAVVVLSAHADGERRWDWVRWLPHCAPRGADCVALVGADPEAAARRTAELAALVAERLDEESPYAKAVRGIRLTGGPTGWDDLGGAHQGWGGRPAFPAYSDRPHDVLLVLDGAQVLRGMPGMPQVLRQGPRAGIFTIAVDDDRRLLPEECAAVISGTADGRLHLSGGGLEETGEVLADLVSAEWADRLARALAPLRDAGRPDAAAALPGSVRLLDLLELPVPSGEAIAARWAARRTTRALIGVGPEGPFTVDLRADGPHALIAGTTGAGKSELLQTLISSLAVGNRPDELTFVLIDYKGGAAFKECVRLPHTVGMVTDLDGHLTERALASLAAEIRRRERLLLAAGVKDIDDYQELRDRHPGEDPPEPLPRLVLIIDEFAALVTELPDFMAGLVDIARRGRSLGIHLILATQRPGGVVTADIQANTSLRIALRVTDATESGDVIDGPEAAGIAKTTPGRCYVRSGAGAPTLVQTARVGGRAPGRAVAGTGLRVTELPWRALGHPVAVPAPAAADGAADTDLARLVDAVRDAAARLGVAEQRSPWLPPLPERVVPAEEDGPPYRPGAQEVPPLAFGTTDLPWAQDRRPLTLDLAHGGHLLIVGAARSGRSTALRTIAGAVARGASPADVHLHAVDCGSGALLPLVSLPHCGAVVTRDQPDRLERLLTRLRAEVGRRQQALAECGYASLAEARAAGRLPDGRHRLATARRGAPGPDEIEREPWLLLLLDRWEGFVAAFEQYDYGRLIEAVLQLLREGPAVGLRAVFTADRSGLFGQISTVFDDRLVLRLADPADYGLAGLPPKGVPTAMPPGRALAVAEQGVVESQLALLAADPAGPAQVAALQELARRAAGRFPEPGKAPLRVDPLPPRITAEQALALCPSFTPPSPLWALAGAGGDALAPLGIDLLAHGPGAIIAGPARSGRSTCLVTAALSLTERGVPVVLVTPRRSPLRALAGAPHVLAVLDGTAADLGAAGRERFAVLVDDAELISPDSPLGMALEEVLRTGRDGEHGLLLAGATGDLSSAYRGFVAEARKSRTGLLLSVQGPADGDLFGVRLPRGATGGPPGRGLLVASGAVTPVQAALPA